MFNHQKPTITLTGATGFLGSHLMYSFIQKGFPLIILGRSKQGISLKERIVKLLKWFDLNGEDYQVKTYEIDYYKPFLGLSAPEFHDISSQTDELVHCASDTCFSETKRDRVFDFNVNQLSGILELASTAKVNCFSYISTAYSAGINGQLCREKLSTAKEFVNAYEESKAKAEQVISDYCQNHSIPLKIIRPTIVYGNSNTGRTLRFNAFYFPIRSLLSIKEIYLNDIQKNGGKRSSRYGIHLDKDGFLFLPMHFYLPRRGSINLIPVDYFVQATIKILEHEGGGIYHVSNHVTSDLDQLADLIRNFLKIRGVEVIYGKPEKTFLPNPVEELFDRFIEPYRPYLSDDRIFERINTDHVTGNMAAPVMSEQIFRNCMNYAIEVNWGEFF